MAKSPSPDSAGLVSQKVAVNNPYYLCQRAVPGSWRIGRRLSEIVAD